MENRKSFSYDILMKSNLATAPLGKNVCQVAQNVCLKNQAWDRYIDDVYVSWYVWWRVQNEPVCLLVCWLKGVSHILPTIATVQRQQFFFDHGTLSKVESIYYYCSISVLPKGKGPPSPTRAYQALPGITPAGGGGGGGGGGGRGGGG